MQSENRGVKRNSAGKLPELINHLIKKNITIKKWHFLAI